MMRSAVPSASAVAPAETPAADNDRVAALFGGERRRRYTIVTPEGVPLQVAIATRGERIGAFLLDALIWLGSTFSVYLLLGFAVVGGIDGGAIISLCLLAAFLIRNLYFIQFELAWNGATPGKRRYGLKVIDRRGGALTAAAVVARNLTREVEIFVPLALLLQLSVSNADTALTNLLNLAWIALIACLPLFSRHGLRAGDLIAGTMVIAVPKQALLRDLAELPHADGGSRYRFTTAQLATYGAFELQVLETILREPATAQSSATLIQIRDRICRRIGWHEPVSPHDTRSFLNAFYTAQRAELERGQVFGQFRADKTAKSETTLSRTRF